MTHESALAVARIIQRHEPLHVEVLSCRHEVPWPDGSAVQLHPVRQRGTDTHNLRAFFHDGQWTLFDLKAIAPKVEAELHGEHLRDHPGLVMYGLRRTFHNAPDFRDAVAARHLARWPGEDREAGTRPTGTGRVPTSPHHQPSPSPSLGLRYHAEA